MRNPEALNILQEIETFSETIATFVEKAIQALGELAISSEFSKTIPNLTARRNEYFGDIMRLIKETKGRTQQKEESKKKNVDIAFIHTWDSNVVALFNPNTKEKKVITFDNDCVIANFADSIEFEKRIFVMGNEYCSTGVYEINVLGKKKIKKANMIMGKHGHSLCKTQYDIYSIGGSKHKENLNECEKYSVSEDKWYSLPNLLEVRYRCAAFTYNNIEVYALAGNGSSWNLNTMEKMVINNSKGWEIVNISNPLSPRRNLHGIQIRKNEVLIFGGYDKDRLSDCYTLTIDENVECRKTCDLVLSGMFFATSAPVCDNECMYGVDYQRNIHIYSLEDNKWSVVKPSNN